jgi:hypothetical protein
MAFNPITRKRLQPCQHGPLPAHNACALTDRFGQPVRISTDKHSKTPPP